MRSRVIMAVLLILILVLSSCSEKEPIQIGFVGTLSGSNSVIGIAMRDGMLLKVDELNAQGGINGRPIEVIIRDDNNDWETIQSINEGFIADGIGVIFGHELSSKAEPLMKAVKDKRVIVMSPTLSTYEISGIDDNFFRTIPSNFDQGTTIGAYANERSSKTLLIYDDDNKKFADGVNEGYIDRFDGDTDEYAVVGDLHDKADEVAELFEEGQFDSVMYVMNPTDVMYMSQVLYSRGLEVDVYSSNWGMAVNALAEGGKAIENATFVSFMGNLDNANYVVFRESYLNKYKKEPEFAAVYSYEAASLLFTAIEKSGDIEFEMVKEQLLTLGEQPGLISPLKLDEYGDVTRDLFLAVVKDGKLVTLE